MNFISKLERKYGRYAIHNLMYYIIILYGIGLVISLFMPGVYSNFFALDANMILHGQVWRIFTFLMNPPGSSLFMSLIAMYMYYLIGTNIERQWGAFRFNLYFFTGVLGHVIAAFVLFFITGVSYHLGTSYLNLSLFFAFAAIYPDMQFLLFFILPIKVKYLAYINGLVFLYSIIIGTMDVKIAAILSLANFILFFVGTRDYKKLSPKEIKRKKAFNAQSMSAKNITTHKCAICGRTEKDGDDLVFRFCSKCDGNYEYCQDHLFTHTHVKK